MTDKKKTKDGNLVFPVLPLRDIVVFPYMIVPLFVGREKSIAALEEVMRTDKQILLAAQKNASDDDPEPALVQIVPADILIRPGESLALVGENGAGKTTLIKLLTRLYRPDSGHILLDGLDLEQWDEERLRQRIGVIFQDFARYQFLVGENIGVGDVRHFEDQPRWETAAEKGMADEIIAKLPASYATQLGKWFKGGVELSGGQWQKIALSRAFMREAADILVLDEPTAAMDAAAEATIFEHFRKLTENRIAILISHRFSTVRMASQIVVINDDGKGGRIIERGNHEQLMQLDGHYARLFSLQAAGYQ